MLNTASQKTSSWARETKLANPTKCPGCADRRVGQAEPEAEPQRIGEKHQQERRRGERSDDAENVAIVEQASAAPAAPAIGAPSAGPA